MKNIFNSVKLTKPKTNYFDLTHDVKLSGKMGNLMPVLALECVPGDKVQIGSDILARFAPMSAPIMHRVDVTVHYFFCPNRLVWESWEDFITERANTDPSAGPAPVWPYINLVEGNLSTDTIALLDYMGVPPMPAGGTPTQISAIPLAVYNRIWYDYYRDQNLQQESELIYELNDGDNDGKLATFIMRQRAWEHDYFSAALPWAQKGAEVVIPFNTMDMPVKYNQSVDTILTGAPNNISVDAQTTNNPDIAGAELYARPNAADTEGAPSINDFRRAYKLQEWLEKNALGGSRYIENILVHFGVRSSDKRLQRPEYITGIKAPVIISEVLNTTGIEIAGSGGAPQGTMAGHGISANGGFSGSYYVEEHGIVMAILSVMPKPAYQQGIHKMWKKSDPLDYFWPTFAHLGEQPVTNDEIYAYTPQKDETFGYVPRYAEYKYMPSRVAGEFRTTLNFWHLGRIFSAPPALNADFVTVQPDDVNRIFAVTAQDEDNVFFHILHKIGMHRRMPKYGTPAI